jgi:hypothetical protein
MTTLFDYIKCIFLDNEFSCENCDFKDNICLEQFYKKYGKV